MNPAFKKFGKALCEKIVGFLQSDNLTAENADVSALKALLDPLQAALEAGADNKALLKLGLDLVPRFEKLNSEYRRKNQAQNPDFLQLLTRLEHHIFALNILVSLNPKHKNKVNLPLLQAHFKNFLKVQSFAIKLDKKTEEETVSFEFYPQNDQEKASIKRFVDALATLGMSCYFADDESKTTISRLNPTDILALAQYPVKGDERKATLHLAHAVREILTTEESFCKQMQDMVKQLDKKIPLVRDKLIQEIQGLIKEQSEKETALSSAKTVLAICRSSNPKLNNDTTQAIEKNILKLTTELKDITNSLKDKQNKLDCLAGVLEHYKVIAEDPYPWMSQEETEAFLNIKPVDVTFRQIVRVLFRIGQVLSNAKQDQSQPPRNKFLQRLESFNWIILNGESIMQFINKENILELNSSQLEQDLLELSTTNYLGVRLKKSEKALFDEFSNVAITRLPRYSLLFNAVSTALNGVTIENCSRSKVGLLHAVNQIEAFFAQRSKSINAKKQSYADSRKARKLEVVSKSKVEAEEDLLDSIFASIGSLFKSSKIKEETPAAQSSDLIQDFSYSMINNSFSASTLHQLPQFTLDGLGSMLGDSFISNKAEPDALEEPEPTEAIDTPEQIEVALEQMVADELELEFIDGAHEQIYASLNQQFLNWDKSMELRAPGVDDTLEKEAKKCIVEIESSEQRFHDSQTNWSELQAQADAAEKPQKVCLPRIELAEVASPSPEEECITKISDDYSLSFRAVLSTDSLFINFGRYFDPMFLRDVRPIDIKLTEMSIARESIEKVKSTIFSQKETVEFYEVTKSIVDEYAIKPFASTKEDNSISKVLYIDAKKLGAEIRDTQAAIDWITEKWNDQTRANGYFIVVGQGNMRSFMAAWNKEQFQTPQIINDLPMKVIRVAVGTLLPGKPSIELTDVADFIDPEITIDEDNWYFKFQSADDVKRIRAILTDRPEIIIHKALSEEGSNREIILAVDRSTIVSFLQDVCQIPNSTLAGLYHDEVVISSSMSSKSPIGIEITKSPIIEDITTLDADGQLQSKKKVTEPGEGERTYKHYKTVFGKKVQHKEFENIYLDQKREKEEKQAKEKAARQAALNPPPVVNGPSLPVPTNPEADAYFYSLSGKKKSQPNISVEDSVNKPSVAPIQLTQSPKVESEPEIPVGEIVILDNKPAPISQPPAEKSKWKTFLWGFFNPSTWGLVFLLAIGLGSVVQGFGGSVTASVSIAILHGLAPVSAVALIVSSVFLLISAVVYLGRLANTLNNDNATGKRIAPSSLRAGSLLLGMIFGGLAIVAMSVLFGVGGIPSDLAWLKTTLEFVGQMLATIFKGIGLDLPAAGELTSYLAAAAFMALPVIFTAIMVERFITAYFFNIEEPEENASGEAVHDDADQSQVQADSVEDDKVEFTCGDVFSCLFTSETKPTAPVVVKVTTQNQPQ